MPDTTNTTPFAGIAFEALDVIEQTCRVTTEGLVSDDNASAIEWDWRILGPSSFGVLLGLTIKPTEERGLFVQIRMVGRFRYQDPPTAVPGFADFVRWGASAIMMPHLRHTLLTLTSNVPGGAIHLPLLNVRQLLAKMELTKTTGWTQLAEHPEFAQRVELDPGESVENPDRSEETPVDPGTQSGTKSP